MSPYKTSFSLLRGLSDTDNQAAWQRFDSLYRPMLHKFCLRLGLDNDSAEDATQRAEFALYKAMQEGLYDPKKGKFRSWLFAIARNQVRDLCAERLKQPLSTGQRSSVDGAYTYASDPQTMATLWEQQWQEHVLNVCIERTRRTFSKRYLRVFDLLTFERIGADEVARKMDMTCDAVYQIKHRVLQFMRGVRAELESDG